MSATGVLRVLVHSNVIISLSATSVALTTMILAGFPFDPIPLFIVFAATLFVYSLNRVTDLEEDTTNVPQRAAFVRRYGRLVLGTGALSYVVAVALALWLDLPLAGFLLAPLVLGVAYSANWLKRRFLLKNLTVGVGWGIVPLGVGVYFGRLQSPEILALAVYVTCMLTLAAVIFDVKDIEGDIEAGIRTVPNRYGPRRTRRWCQAANLLVATGVVCCVVLGVVPATFLALLAFHAYVGAYVAVATPDRGPLFYGLVVDGEHLFLASFLVVLSSIGAI